jgi:hypothetical protein
VPFGKHVSFELLRYNVQQVIQQQISTGCGMAVAAAPRRRSRFRIPFPAQARHVNSRTVYLPSGKWRCYLDVARTGDQFLEFVDPARPQNRMTARVGYSLPEPTDEQLTELARNPLLRLWVDEAGILWRVAAVGPGTPYEYPLRARHLIFDSEVTWAGIVPFPEGLRLGELHDAALRGYRDSIADFGGRRRSYRRPNKLSAE